MKPITDDMVFSILQGLEKRERKPQGKKMTKANKMTARILGPIGDKRIVSLNVARQARRTVSGMFCYVAKH